MAFAAAAAWYDGAEEQPCAEGVRVAAEHDDRHGEEADREVVRDVMAPSDAGVQPPEREPTRDGAAQGRDGVFSRDARPARGRFHTLFAHRVAFLQV